MIRTHSTCVLLAATLAATALANAPGVKSTSDMTGPWQLFIDDHLIASRAGLQRTWHPFEKYAGNPVIVVDQPWEYRTVKVISVLPAENGRGFRLWYGSGSPPEDPDRGHSLYATSEDGFRWVKPKLGQRAWKVTGSTETNIVDGSGAIMHTPGDPDPARRYKAGTSGGTYVINMSPDGLHWSRLSKSTIFNAGDVGRFHWDPSTNTYHGYAKVGAHVSGLRRRAVGHSSETTNFDLWPPLRLVLAPDDIDDRWVQPNTVQRTHFYGMQTCAYETVTLGLLWIFRAEDIEGYFHGPMYTEIASSRDTIHWLREDGDRPAMVPCGPAGAWDAGMIAAAGFVVNGDQILLYYSGYKEGHDILPMHSSIGVATLRKDGFASMDAGNEEATLTTKQLVGVAGELQVNGVTGSGGKILVEVLDAEGRVIPGYERDACTPIEGDQMRAAVTWKNQKELPKGDANGGIRLRFILNQASLYSFNAGPGIRVIEEKSGPCLAALYTFEGDQRFGATDKLLEDGRNKLDFLGSSRVEREKSQAAFGQQELAISTPWRPWNRVAIRGTKELGKQFTLAAAVKMSVQQRSRLFSSAGGHRPINCSELVLECDPRNATGAALRLYAKGIPVESKAIRFDDGAYHHLAVTYDDGEVHFYVDGEDAGVAYVPGGLPVTLANDLLFGEDRELGSDEQLNGYVDDILVLGKVLPASDIRKLAKEGAAVLFNIKEPDPPVIVPKKKKDK